MDTRLTADKQAIVYEVRAKMDKKYKEIREKLNKENPQASITDVSNVPKSKRVQHSNLFEDLKSGLEKHGKEETEDNEDDEVKSDTTRRFMIYHDENCLSMHQPWASLVVVLGLKRFEGRM